MADESDSVGKFPDRYGHTVSVDVQGAASFDSVPYGHYKVYVMLKGDELTKPSWTHDEVQVELNGSHAEAVVKLRKVRVSDHQPWSALGKPKSDKRRIPSVVPPRLPSGNAGVTSVEWAV